MSSRRWQELERTAAKALGGRRVTEPWYLFNERPDVVVELPGQDRRLIVDCKAYQRFAHHTLLDDVQRKYCEKHGDVPALVTKHSGQVGAFVTVPLAFLAELLDVDRGARQQLTHGSLHSNGAA